MSDFEKLLAFDKLSIDLNEEAKKECSYLSYSKYERNISSKFNIIYSKKIGKNQSFFIFFIFFQDFQLFIKEKSYNNIETKIVEVLYGFRVIKS